MREYTEVYGVLRLHTSKHEFEIEINCKRKTLFYPVTTHMTEEQMVALLSNHAPFKLKTNVALVESLSSVLNNVRTVIFQSIRSNMVIDRALIQSYLPAPFVVRTIGTPDVKEDRAIMIPSDATVSIALETYPIKWRGTELDRCRVSDYSEAS